MDDPAFDFLQIYGQNMAEPALPHDILRVISAHWAGHRLHYTCTAIYASWKPDDYVIIDATANISTSRMPNGAYHGKCAAVQPIFTETIEYDRGEIVSVTYDHNVMYVVEILINGWTCRWRYDYFHAASRAGNERFGDEWLGDVCAFSYRLHPPHVLQRKKVALRDFTAVARELVEQSGLYGDIKTLHLCSALKGLPHTR